MKKKLNFFWSKTAIYLSLGLHKWCPGYRRSLQLTKEAIQHFKTWIFSTFVGHFCPPGSGSGSVFKLRIRIQYGSGSETLRRTLTKLRFLPLGVRLFPIQLRFILIDILCLYRDVPVDPNNLFLASNSHIPILKTLLFFTLKVHDSHKSLLLSSEELLRPILCLYRYVGAGTSWSEYLISCLELSSRHLKNTDIFTLKTHDSPRSLPLSFEELLWPILCLYRDVPVDPNNLFLASNSHLAIFKTLIFFTLKAHDSPKSLPLSFEELLRPACPIRTFIKCLPRHPCDTS